jgi:large subunit ribosomal protein L24
MNFKKGDTVRILAGKDRGKTGAVLRVLPDEGRVVVEGVNVMVKRVRPRRQNQKGEMVSLPRPLSASKVMLVCGNCKKPTRVGRRRDGSTSVRFCVRCDASIV